MYFLLKTKDARRHLRASQGISHALDELLLGASDHTSRMHRIEDGDEGLKDLICYYVSF